MSNKISKLLCVVGIAVAASTASSAHADTALQNASCVINYVQYSADQLTVRCVNTGAYYGVFGPAFSGCSYKQSADSMKIMSSIAQSAYLSQHPVILNYYANNSGGCPGQPVTLIALN